MSINGSLLISVILALAFGEACGGEIYRWTDEQGKTHFSDSVPDQYRKSAQRIDTHALEPSAEQRQQAMDRVAAERNESALQKATTSAQGGGNQGAADTNAGANAVAAAAQRATSKKDCATLHRLYRESMDCFAPYHLINGGVKAEAFRHCVEVLDPSTQCGPASQYK